MSNEDIKERIRKAIREFIKKDREYLTKVDVYETTISHRIAIYLENEFLGWDVDCEYNKYMDKRKTNSAGKKIRPDIIIHKRGCEDNLCIFEVKKAGIVSKKGKNDINKLKDAVESSNLHYRLGVFVGVLKRRIDLYWIEKVNGKVKEIQEILR